MMPWRPSDFPKSSTNLGSANIALYWLRYIDREFSEGEHAYEPLERFASWARGKMAEEDLGVLHDRRETLLRSLGPQLIAHVTGQWRAAIGLGDVSNFENSGVALHATFGFPVIPASSLKGLARHWIAHEMTHCSDLYSTAARLGLAEDGAEFLFGRAPKAEGPSANDGSNDDHAAAVRIHDAWPDFDSSGWFDVDILTPHHSRYAGRTLEWPLDTESPVPVPFLTIREGISFRIPLGFTALGRRLECDAGVLEWTAAVLKAALDWHGVGAKTAAGYGRFSDAERSTP